MSERTSVGAFVPAEVFSKFPGLAAYEAPF